MLPSCFLANCLLLGCHPPAVASMHQTLLNTISLHVRFPSRGALLQEASMDEAPEQVTR